MQISYVMIGVTVAILVLFAWIHIAAASESPLADSGTNFGVTAIMVLILFVLASFVSLQITIDKGHL
jgi:hypothetical protein